MNENQSIGISLTHLSLASHRAEDFLLQDDQMALLHAVLPYFSERLVNGELLLSWGIF